MVGKEKEVVLVLSRGEHSSVDSNHERGVRLEGAAVRGRLRRRDARSLGCVPHILPNRELDQGLLTARAEDATG